MSVPATEVGPRLSDRLSRHPLSVRRLWLFRLSSMVIAPALFLLTVEFALKAIGYGYQTSLFLGTRVDGQPAFVENLDFTRPYFPAGLERAPLPLVLGADKASRTYRIFVLGESAAMGFPGPSFSFARILQIMLRDRFPDRDFEVVNTAMTAINSHVIVPIALECANHQPDLYIVYMGNNEVVGPFGASGVFGVPVENISSLRALLQFKRSRTCQAMSSLIQIASGGKATPSDWNGMSMLINHGVRETDPRLSSVYSHFHQNLQDICQAGTNSGADVIICTVATNVKDSPPFDSLPRPDLSTDQAAEWDSLFKKGCEQESAKNFAGAVESFSAAAVIDDHRADLHFRWARSLMAIDRVAEARRHYGLARDRDTLRFRADSSINAEIRAVAERAESHRIHLVDIEREIERASPAGLPGGDHFYEHVHFNFAGNYLVARALFDRVVRLVTASAETDPGIADEALSKEECKQRLAFTNWNELNCLQDVAQLFSSAPFTNQIDSPKRLSEIKHQISGLQSRLTGEALEEVANAYRLALNQSESDVPLHMDYGLLLMSQRRYAQATEQFFVVQRSLPHHPAPHVLIAHSLAAQGKLDEAVRHCEYAIQLRSGWPQAVELRNRLISMSGRRAVGDGF